MVCYGLSGHICYNLTAGHDCCVTLTRRSAATVLVESAMAVAGLMHGPLSLKAGTPLVPATRTPQLAAPIFRRTMHVAQVLHSERTLSDVRGVCTAQPAH
jgi:hypothetical protein